MGEPLCSRDFSREKHEFSPPAGALSICMTYLYTSPVIASGGVGTLEHFVEGAQVGATGLLAASVFHFGTFTIAQVKDALAEAGLPVRVLPAAVV